MELLMNLLRDGVTQYHVVKNAGHYLEVSGFTELSMDKTWRLNKNAAYFVRPYPSMLVAFTLGQQPENLRITTAHTDFPMLKIKSNPDIKREGYQLLNVEPYGGLIMETWFDRILGMAGKVVIKGEDPFNPKVEIFDMEKDVCVIPNLAPHLKRGEKTEKINPQKELIPVIGLEKNGLDKDFINMISEKLQVNTEDILDYDIYLYNREKPVIWGENDEFLSAGRIDNISSVAAQIESVTGIYEEMKKDKEAHLKNINLAVMFDNEEIGSRSKQGADSVLFAKIIDKIFAGMGLTEEEISKLNSRSFMASLDVAHGVHPNYSEKSDPTNKTPLGQGFVLKSSASQRYVSDSEAAAVIVALCKDKKIMYQKQVNKSGMAGGQTLGPIVSSYIPVKAVDMGIPILAMHSAMELAALNDYRELCKILFALYN